MQKATKSQEKAERPPTRPPGPREIPGGPTVRLPCRWYHGISGRYNQARSQTRSQTRSSSQSSDQGSKAATRAPGHQGTKAAARQRPGHPGDAAAARQRPGHPRQAAAARQRARQPRTKKDRSSPGKSDLQSPDYDTGAEASDSSADPEMPSCNAPKMEV